MKRMQAQLDVTDELMDEMTQSAELLKLQRKLRVMENERKAYDEESRLSLRKQEYEIASLLKENSEVKTDLKVTNSYAKWTNDMQAIQRLSDLTEELEMCNAQTEAEEARIKELDATIKFLEHSILTNKKQKSGVTDTMESKAIRKTMNTMENILDKELVKFNKQLSMNACLREKIDHLRQDRLLFNGLSKKLTKELREIKKSMNVICRDASQAYEEREEAQNKMMALKDKSEKDIAQQEVEMKALNRLIDHDNRLKKFMAFKASERTELKDEEEAKKKKCSGNQDMDIEKFQINALEEAFKELREETGEDDIDVIVSNFAWKENENFALFKFVNELNIEVEQIQDEIHAMNKEIEQFTKDDTEHEGVCFQMMKELEEKSEIIRYKIESSEKKNVQMKKTLDELRSGVSLLFRGLQCDRSSIEDMLGSDDGVTNKNILPYMGIIEQKTTELLQAQQYLQMTLNQPPQETKAESTTLENQQAQRPHRPPTASVKPPDAGEDDEVFNYAEGMDVRPLTHEELRSAIINKFNRKCASS
ncbi:outer dynein arm-docking complex subunit 1-like [Ostrea edulis]|uniref:outer dynein arm-docking complex subunit 1-like n=1 Tax=Ostrea edulis TaxID=37623 RepID=UPI0024AEB1BF|nr:outer dynein arm-docking complex subunit 1-like [Ostrea edulis]